MGEVKRVSKTASPKVSKFYSHDLWAAENIQERKETGGSPPNLIRICLSSPTHSFAAPAFRVHVTHSELRGRIPHSGTQ